MLAGALPWISPSWLPRAMYHGTFRPCGRERLLRALEQAGIARERGVRAAGRRGLVRVPEAAVAVGRARRGSRRSRRRRCSWRAATSALSARDRLRRRAGARVGRADRLAARTDRPCPPSSTVLNQRVSLSCWLSARSPVVIDEAELRALAACPADRARAVGVDVAHDRSKTCRPSASCGRPGHDAHHRPELDLRPPALRRDRQLRRRRQPLGHDRERLQRRSSRAPFRCTRTTCTAASQPGWREPPARA